MATNIYERDGLSIIVIENNQGDYILVEDFLLEKFKTIKVKQFIEFKTFSAFHKNELNRCDLILLDMHLPDAGGIDLIKNMVQLCIDIPIIILTGYSDLALAKKSLELGIYDFLVKDEINPNLLHKSIEFALSRSNYVRHIEIQNEKLRKIAWTQSHVVRAPLARILGIVNLIGIMNDDYTELPFMLEQLKISSMEMDDIVRSIVNETQTLNIKK